MFERRRKKPWVGKAAGLVALLALSAFTVAFYAREEGEEGQQPLSLETAEEAPEQGESRQQNDRKTEGQTGLRQTVPPEAETDLPYYLLKEEAGVVKLFYCTAEKQQIFQRDTEIPFSLLQPADQELFRSGIRKWTEEELQEFLQDFES